MRGIGVVIIVMTALVALCLSQPTRFHDRFVWVFGWGLGRDEDVPQIVSVLETADRKSVV